MNKKLIIALVIIVVTAIVLLFNMRGMNAKMDIDLVILPVIHTFKSIILMGFTVTGVVIGLLLK